MGSSSSRGGVMSITSRGYSRNQSDQLCHRALRGVLGPDHEIRVGRRLEGTVESRDVAREPGAALRVEPLGIARFTDTQLGGHVDLEEAAPVLVVMGAHFRACD